jgi:predicted Ser/Thr protein kinase
MPTESSPGAHSESVTRAIEPRRDVQPPPPPLELVVDQDIPVAPGELVGGRYLIEGVLAEGGMGIVYIATHTELEQRVAIKFLRDTYARTDSLVQRFLNEARAAAVLKSDHVVRVIDVGQLDSGRPYLVMEHLDGMDLEGLLVREGPFDVERAIGYTLEVCSALEEAHSSGIVHRDIKPENLFLATAGSGRQKVKVVDFGLAKRLDAAPLVVTGPQDSMGSPCYMSPEQITTPHEIDARTDIWSLGCVLYRMLTLTMPFDGSTVLEVYARVLNAQPKPLRTVRPELDRGIEMIVERCLQKDPKRRYQTIGELAAALTAYQSAQVITESAVAVPSAEVISVVEPVIPRRRGPSLFTVALLVLVASFCGAWAVRDMHAQTEARARLRGWIALAMPHASGDVETALENADLALAPTELPDDPKVANLGDRYVPLVLPSFGVTSRHPVRVLRGGDTLMAEHEHELSAVAQGVSAAPEDSPDEEDAAEKQADYRRFIENQRSIANQVDAVQNGNSNEPAHAATVAPPAPKPAKQSIDDLKAP